MRHLLLVSSLAFSMFCSAQARNNHWMMGEDIQIDFGTMPPTSTNTLVAASGPHITCISDTSGTLEFYFDGYDFYDRLNGLMEGGNGDSLWTPSWAQQMKTVIVPQPDAPDLYYVFMVDRPDMGRAGYVVVDMSMNGGLGAVISDTVHYYLDSASCKIAATLTTEGDSYWILHHEMGNNEFAAFRLSSAGFDTVPVISHAGTPFPYGWLDPYGSMTFSMDGSLLVSGTFYTNYDTLSTNDLSHFDISTGQVEYITSFPELISPWAEFSPNGRQLYWYAQKDNMLGNYSKELWQYSLVSLLPADIHASAFLVHSDAPDSMSYQGVQLLLAPDRRIYIVHGASYLAAINEPDLPGATCWYQGAAIQVAPAFPVWWFQSFCKRYHDSEPAYLGVTHPNDPGSTSVGSAYPVPADAQATVPLNGLTEGAVLRVHDARGALVSEQRIAANSTQAVITTAGLPSGMYSYQLLGNSGASAARTLVVTH